ncbi:MAG: hypothetical protein ACE37N_14490 [Pseudohongiellaceae bacterium]
MQSFFLAVVFLSACLPIAATAQTDLIAPVTGSVTGLVENDNGEMVAPQAAVSATVIATDNNGVITADISGTASCTGGLGLHFNFEAQYNASENSFSGMYSDVPGSAPDQELLFSSDGGNMWTAQLSGDAPSDSGSRSYDLQFQFEVPEAAIFQGNSIPEERSYGGVLSAVQSVSVPVNVPQAGISQTLDFNVEFTGSWSAVAVPQLDGSSVFTGEASGSFASSNTEEVSVSLPDTDAFSIPVQVGGSFGGSLFLIDEDTVSFQGAWVASGSAQSFGGDMSIDIEFSDTSSFPFTIDGVIPVETGLEQLPTVNIPFSTSGSFPLSLQ